jgi:tetratricopeptide (TPR) repeat protein
MTRPHLDGRVFAILVLSTALLSARVEAADQWIEVKSAHFVLTSNASEGATKRLAWQLEQVRSAIGVLWPWAKLDLTKPLSVLVVKDENSMKALVPSYWERKGGTRPATVWVGGADQNYLAIRTDTETRDELNINPYVTSYFSYVSLILQQSVPRPMPLWFSRGLAGVLSNTVVRDAKIFLGPPIPWHLERLREGSRLTTAALLKVDRHSPEYLDGEGLRGFDAQAWAFVHFLMFGENGARWPKLDQFARMTASGADPEVAFREALGKPEDFTGPFLAYVNRSLFTFRQINVDVTVKREGFTVTRLGAGDAAARRALLHAAMRRPIEARAAIAEARQAGVAEGDVAEALLLEAEDKDDAALAAFTKAVDAGSTSAYAHYRLASLLWRGEPDDATMARVEKLLARAVALNPRYPAAFAMLADARSVLKMGTPVGMALHAISLAPGEPHYRLTAARILWREGKYDDALKHAEAALAIADSEAERQRASDTIARITRAKAGGPY